MKALRQGIWFLQAFWEKYKPMIIGSFLASLVLAGVIFLLAPALPQPKKVVYVGVVGKFTLTQIPEQVEKKLGMGLTTIGEDLEPTPGLAESWSISNEGKVYDFKLRKDLKWSDGKEIKANDLDFAIPNVTVEKKNEYELVFTLPESFSPFPSVLSRPVIKNGSLTAGEYSIEDLKLNGKYLDKVTLNSDKDTIVYKFYDSLSQALVAFRLGQIDQLEGLLNKPEEGDWPNVSLTSTVKKDMYVAVFYNTDNPLLKEKSVRQALSYAIKNKTYGQLRSLSPINPSSWAYNKFTKDYEYNVERAKDLLSKATDGNKDLKLELTTEPEFLYMAEDIANDWKAIGVSTDVKVVSSSSSGSQASIRAEDIPADPDQYVYWHSTQSTNLVGLQSAKIDKLLEDGRQTSGRDERRQIYLDFQRFLAEEAPATFMFYPTTYTLTRRGL